MEKDIFRREPFSLLTAKSGWEALEMMAREKPALVFMDFYMPNGRGDEACARAKADPVLQSIPIVIVTNSRNPEDLDACRRAGCNDILYKPFDRERFLAVTSRWLWISASESARVKVRLPVRFGTDRESLTDAWSFDLGLGGIFVDTDRLVPLGTELVLEVSLPALKTTLSGTARVARIQVPADRSGAIYPRGLGLQFLDMAASHRETLKIFLRWMKTRARVSKRQVEETHTQQGKVLQLPTPVLAGGGSGGKYGL
jgi:uncharacterized protein (TIGR02266 family)